MTNTNYSLSWKFRKMWDKTHDAIWLQYDRLFDPTSPESVTYANTTEIYADDLNALCIEIEGQLKENSGGRF